MLTEQGCRERQARLWNAVDNDIHWLLVADRRHVQYLANFWIDPVSFSANERALLFLDRDNGVTLLADNFAFRSRSGEPVCDHCIIEPWYDHQRSVINRDHALLSAVRDHVAPQVKARPGLLETERISVAAQQILGLAASQHPIQSETNPNSDCDSLNSSIRQLRRQKDPDEIAVLQLCMRSTEAGHAHARQIIQPGISEFDVYREVHSAVLEAAQRPVIVYGDFRAVNAGTPKVGGLPTDYRLQQGDLFILDYSVVIDGYRSDFTNTIAVGNPTDKQRALFELCQTAMDCGESSLRAGRDAKAVYAAVSAPFEKAGHGALVHHAGHGIGLEHPEPPILVPESHDVLLAGDVVTLEPGVYLEGVGGIRIENNYLVTDNGCERLSHHNIALE